jgi:GNAT superfamily N-acetyltransferase
MEIRYTNTTPDRQEYFELFESTGWNREYALSEDALMKSLAKSWCMVSAYEGSRLVGFGRALGDGILHALIVDLIVLPSHQGQGIGCAILAKLVGRCQEAGIRDVQLFCARGKAGFYQQCGFVERPADAPGMELRK